MNFIMKDSVEEIYNDVIETISSRKYQLSGDNLEKFIEILNETKNSM